MLHPGVGWTGGDFPSHFKIRSETPILNSAYLIVSGKVNQIWMQNVTFSVILVVFCSFCDDRSPSSEGVGRSDLEVLQILDDI